MWPLIRSVDHITGKVYTEPVTADQCWKCGTERPDLAHATFEYLAAVLAEPLRRAFAAHLDEHGCERPHGFGSCPEAMRLFRLLPEDDRVIVA